jgi:hypothetical protein
MRESSIPARRPLALAVQLLGGMLAVASAVVTLAYGQEEQRLPISSPTDIVEDDAAMNAVSDPGATAAGMATEAEAAAAESALEKLELADAPVTIVVGDQRIKGDIKRLDDSGIEFEPAVGQGRITFTYEELDHVETRNKFHFLDEDGNEYIGRILGIDQSGLKVGDSDENAVWVPTSMIAIGVNEESYAGSRMTRLRTKWNHWSAVVDLGIEIDSGAIEKQKANTTATIDHDKRPWGATWFMEYAFESQKDKQEPADPRRVTKDEFRSYLNIQRDIRQSRWIGYFFAGGEFDLPRNVTERYYPSVGTGYRIADSKRGSLELRGGLGGVVAEFSDSPQPGSSERREYFAGQVASTATLKLPRNSELRGFAMYMPAFEGPGKHWLFRFDLTLTVPIFDPLALRMRLSEVNDDNPSTAGNNKTVFVTALAVRF